MIKGKIIEGKREKEKRRKKKEIKCYYSLLIESHCE
jgi:hypothetical protein